MPDKLLLDTCILVDYYKYGKKTIKKEKEQMYHSAAAKNLIVGAIQHKKDLYATVQTIKELLQYPDISPKEESRILDGLPRYCKILPTNWNITVKAGRLARDIHIFRTTKIEDCYIAAAAIVYKLPLYTRNVKDFREINDPTLKLIVPYDYHEDIQGEP